HGGEMDMQQEVSMADYEFDAPSVVIDFKSLDREDNADHWFDQIAEPESKTMDLHTTPFKAKGEAKTDVPKAFVLPMVHDANRGTECGAEGEKPSAPAVSSNLVTSWSHWPSTDNQPQRKALPAQPRRVSKRLSGHQKMENQRKQMAKIRDPPVKKLRKRYKISLLTTGINIFNRSANHTTREETISETTRRSNSSAKFKSTEQQELEKIHSLQKEVAEQRKKNETTFKAAIAGSQPAKKTVIPHTVPVDFHFRTDDRIKPHGDHQSDASYKEVDFAAQLRKHPPSPAKVSKGHTIPKPFNLSSGTKRKFEETAYVPMAQQIEQFQSRFTSKYLCDKNSRPFLLSDMLSCEFAVTTEIQKVQKGLRLNHLKGVPFCMAFSVPKSQSFKFKALELNRKVLDGALVPKKPPVKESTQPIGFDLEIEKRLQEREASKKPEAQDEYTFHSRPLPVKILEDVVGVPEKKHLPPTVPQSPAFALKNRVRIETRKEEEKECPVIKAHPMPHFGLPFQPKPLENKHVEVCPFSFDARERERLALKEKKLEELRHEEVPNFKAQPLPDFSEVHLPEKKVAEATKVQPFKLLIDERGAKKTEHWEQALKEELRQQAEAASFRARPNTVTHKEPFVPKKENRPTTVTEGFQLSTERRAKERMEFDHIVAEKERQRALKEEEERREQEEKAKEEISRLRQEQVHKAQPVRRYKPLELKKSEVSLTVPQSPNFSDRFRV
uniref:TPX2 microtubule nucleation factor n=1 Tax=Lepisosteus oculatus TaxID=7918 RepID=W5MG98_LEPOC